jgi:DNA-binding response OmpR family regulator
MLDQVPILIAEDDEHEVELMNRAFQAAGIPNPIQVVQTGKQAVDYLGGIGDFSKRQKYPLPGLMLLDLKLPWMDGFDVLAWLRRHKEYDTLPVVVLTSSKLQSDIDRSRQMGIYDYRVKPHEFNDLVRLLDDVRKCWLDERFNPFALAMCSATKRMPDSV